MNTTLLAGLAAPGVLSRSIAKLGVAVVAFGMSSILAAPSGHANPLPIPSASVTPDVIGNISGVLVANTGLGTFTGSTINGTYTEEVISDTSRGGLLDFIIQVSAGSGSQALATVSNSTFMGFTISDAGYIAPGGTAGTLTSPSAGIAPDEMGASASGVVNFDFSPGISAGSTSDILVIETNATHFTSGLVGVLDGSGTSNGGFAPSAVPGPTAGAGLPGLILAGGFLFAWRRSRRTNRDISPLPAA